MDFRKIILDELERQGRSKYWLAENPGCGVHKTAIYGFLRGDSEGSASTVSAMLGALDLIIVPRDPGKKPPGGKQREGKQKPRKG